jgi:ABC-type nitrate/sulfonate/bicarbonate transport system substrate-binding protein
MRLISFPLLAYAPAFVAQALGFYSDEGIEVDFVSHRGGWAAMNDSLTRGDAEIAIGNLWFAGRWSQPSEVLPVAHCVRQCGSVLVTINSPAAGSFCWTGLRGATVAVQSDVPTPWIAFRECLAAKGVGLADVLVLVGLGTDEVVAALRSGSVDLSLMHAERCLDPDLVEVAALADVVGPVPWSVFFADRRRVAADNESFRAFRTAIERALQYMAEADEGDIVSLITKWFPQYDVATIARLLGRLRRMEAWPATAAIPAEDVARWQSILHRWGMARDTSIPKGVTDEGSAILEAGSSGGMSR